MLKVCLLIGCLSSVAILGAALMPQCFKLQDESCPNQNVTYHIYSPKLRQGRALDPRDYKVFLDLQPVQLKVLIHSFNGNDRSTPVPEVLPYLLRLPEVSVLVVNYHNLAIDPCYTEAAHNAPFVGRCVAQYLTKAIQYNLLRSENLHLIGFGLGAHVAGFISNFISKSGYKVGQITALDPAKALFLTANLNERLDTSDADFVDVIHTDVLIHGILQPIGHVDFFPNKGVTQPNCGPISSINTHECYHRRAAVYYGESIVAKVPMVGFRCENLYAFIMDECRPGRDVEILGYYANPRARGSYYLMTNDRSPYSKGIDFSNLDREIINRTYLGDKIFEKLKELGPDVKALTSRLG